MKNTLIILIITLISPSIFAADGPPPAPAIDREELYFIEEVAMLYGWLPFPYEWEAITRRTKAKSRAPLSFRSIEERIDQIVDPQRTLKELTLPPLAETVDSTGSFIDRLEKVIQQWDYTTYKGAPSKTSLSEVCKECTHESIKLYLKEGSLISQEGILHCEETDSLRLDIAQLVSATAKKLRALVHPETMPENKVIRLVSLIIMVDLFRKRLYNKKFRLEKMLEFYRLCKTQKISKKGLKNLKKRYAGFNPRSECLNSETANDIAKFLIREGADTLELQRIEQAALLPFLPSYKKETGVTLQDLAEYRKHSFNIGRPQAFFAVAREAEVAEKHKTFDLELFEQQRVLLYTPNGAQNMTRVCVNNKDDESCIAYAILIGLGKISHDISDYDAFFEDSATKDEAYKLRNKVAEYAAARYDLLVDRGLCRNPEEQRSVVEDIRNPNKTLEKYVPLFADYLGLAIHVCRLVPPWETRDEFEATLIKTFNPAESKPSGSVYILFIENDQRMIFRPVFYHCDALITSSR